MLVINFYSLLQLGYYGYYVTGLVEEEKRTG